MQNKTTESKRRCGMETVIAALISGIACLACGFALGVVYRKKVGEAEIGSAEIQARKILEDGIRSAENKKKEALLEAKDEIIRTKNDFELELNERRSELTRQERRVQSKEETLDRKTDALEKKDESLTKKLKETTELNESIEKIKEEQYAELQRVAGMTAEEATANLVKQLEGEIKHRQAKRIVELEEEFKETADEKARDIIALAVQRCAADHVSEITVSAVPLPSEEMKGRIIRTIETLTGVDLIIDDTPEAITVSSFDPVRREVARIALEKLIADGRIHPARIEEMVEKARKEVDVTIRQAGERATFDTGIHGINPELVKLLGRLKFRTSYGQNVLAHSVEVSLISGVLADELGVDSTIAKRAGLLHDIGKALTQEVEGSHVQLGVEIARKYKESKEVINAIEAHHGDVEAQTITALIVQAADAISAARPGARRENLENYIKRLTKLEEIANEFDGVEKSYAIQAGREIRIMVKPDVVDDDKMVLIAHDIVKKIEDELEYPGQIKVHMIRESRAIDYAK